MCGGGDYQTKLAQFIVPSMFFRLSEPFTRLWSAVKDEFLL